MLFLGLVDVSDIPLGLYFDSDNAFTGNADKKVCLADGTGAHIAAFVGALWVFVANHELHEVGGNWWVLFYEDLDLPGEQFQAIHHEHSWRMYVVIGVKYFPLPFLPFFLISFFRPLLRPLLRPFLCSFVRSNISHSPSFLLTFLFHKMIKYQYRNQYY